MVLRIINIQKQRKLLNVSVKLLLAIKKLILPYIVSDFKRHTAYQDSRMKINWLAYYFKFVFMSAARSKN